MRHTLTLCTLRIPCNVSLGVFEQPLSATGNPAAMPARYSANPLRTPHHDDPAALAA
ncbi:hypothetical protein [Vogesella mureinivorans]|jgi:hypothetical protein|uniref:hypothetical protein n=1 Tax=Vogesella mureinivorans TaxID=657276 RepID=UPI001478D5D7|nr:hypothetical protein [Vogesella mureinivorans]